MRAASAGMIALLDSSRQFLMADLYTFVLNGGFTVRYTSADTDLSYGGNLFKKFIIDRDKTKVSVGAEVDTLTVTVSPGPADLLNGTSWLTAVRNGALDGAMLSLGRAVMPTWGDTSLGVIELFPSGRVAEVEFSRTNVQLTVKSALELLDTQMPRNVFQSSCINTLFDDACKLRKADFAVSGTVSGGSVVQINSALGQEADYFSLGTIKFESGVNAGITRSVRAYAGGTFILALPLVTACSPGDTFTAYPGCDKLKETCESVKFSNVINFNGQPYIPDPETGV